jgi:uncharacterized repeat protein (TIGR04138 family)
MSSFENSLDTLLARDSRYAREAYVFVQMAMDYYRTKHTKKDVRHVTGGELLQGIRELALDQFGPLASLVLNHWGLFRGEDVGEIVYAFIDLEMMNKSDDDHKEDFAKVIKFDDSMTQDYQW